MRNTYFRRRPWALPGTPGAAAIFEALDMWIELHDTARDHPKVLKLAKDLHISPVLALGHMVSLWTWVLRMAPDGCLESFDVEDIELGAQWDGDPGDLVKAMQRRGLIEHVDGTLHIHDWMDFAGSLKAAGRARASRERKKSAQPCARVRTRADSTLTDRPTDRPDRPTDRPDAPSPCGPDANDGVFCSLKLKDGTEHNVLRSEVESYVETYNVDVLAELRKMRAWLDANPAKRKTPRGIKSFIVGWLSRTGSGSRADKSGAELALEVTT